MKKLDKMFNDSLKKVINQSEFNQFKNHKGFINKFCRKYNLLLTKITTTYETDKPKNMYSFNDNLDGYTIDGIKKSLYKDTKFKYIGLKNNKSYKHQFSLNLN